MKVKITITVGDKIIADSYREPDDVFAQRFYPRHVIEQAQKHCMSQMAEAVDRAIEELLAKPRVETSKPTGMAYDVVGDVS